LIKRAGSYLAGTRARPTLHAQNPNSDPLRKVQSPDPGLLYRPEAGSLGGSLRSAQEESSRDETNKRITAENLLIVMAWRISSGTRGVTLDLRRAPSQQFFERTSFVWNAAPFITGPMKELPC